MEHQITILPSHKIDAIKWDNCIVKNQLGLIYATTVYLNCMATNWSGLVVDDYEAIMPLPWKKTLGIPYLYTPPFTQQLGLIGNQNIATSQLEKAIQKLFKYGSYHFNFGNISIGEQLSTKQKSNFIIDLKCDYEAIKRNYKKGFKANINRANKQSFIYIVSNNFKDAIELYRSYNLKNLQHVSDVEYEQFLGLCATLVTNKQLMVRKVIDTKNELQSVVVLFKDTKRFYNIINYTSTKGRDNKSNAFLYDNLFKELAGTLTLLDFEGSDLIGVKSFYESFGSINQPYYQWHFNKLPWPLNWVKR